MTRGAGLHRPAKPSLESAMTINAEGVSAAQGSIAGRETPRIYKGKRIWRPARTPVYNSIDSYP